MFPGAKYWFGLIALLSCLSSQGQDTLKLIDSSATYFIYKGYYQFLEDPEGKLGIKDITSDKYQQEFKPSTDSFFINHKAPSTYWLKFTLSHQADWKTHWIAESYNFRIYSLTFFYPDKMGKYDSLVAGESQVFRSKPLQHKNFEFPVPLGPGQSGTFYYRIYNPSGRMVSRFPVRSFNAFASYAFTEYLLLGAFYGLILVMALYNLLVYAVVRNRAYLFYILYVINVGLFSLTLDGLGFQYLWPECPEFNTYASPTFLFGMIICLVLYTNHFLNIRERYPRLFLVFRVYLVLRCLVFLYSIWITKHPDRMPFWDLIPFALVYYSAIRSYKDGNRFARFFLGGFTILFIAFIIYTLRVNRLIPTYIWTVYVLNIASVLEMLLLSLAFGDKINAIQKNEIIKDQLNQELEAKVQERTEALELQKEVLEDKMKELDTFVYKASHDIRGPLKSILGLTQLGMTDPGFKEEYFKHIKLSVERLDHTLSNLMTVNKLNHNTVLQEEIHFHQLVEEILASLCHLPHFTRFSVRTSVHQEQPFHSQKENIRSIFQNLIENAFKYRKTDISDPYLKIDIRVASTGCYIKFADNGIGIAPEHHEKVFDMFFKGAGSTEYNSSGLGLYIVKISVEKLGGKIKVHGAEGVGATFEIIL